MKNIYIVACGDGSETDSYFTSLRDAEFLRELLEEEKPGTEVWIETYKPARVYAEGR
jgi:hypothetical protein